MLSLNFLLFPFLYLLYRPIVSTVKTDNLIARFACELENVFETFIALDAHDALLFFLIKFRLDAVPFFASQFAVFILIIP